MKRYIWIYTILLVLIPVLAEARTRLQNDPVLENGLAVIAIGKMLDDNCSTIGYKRMKSYFFARTLYNHARSMGYTHAEIEAYLGSETDKARIKGHARAYLQKQGVNFADRSTYCTVANAEIARQSTVGQYLWAK